MSWVRVAVASSGGADIDQSLQQACSFRIYDVAPESIRFVESRDSREASDKGSPVGDCSGLEMDEFMELLSDCSLLLVSRLEIDAGGKMRIGWVTVYEAAMPVEKALLKLSRSPLFRRALGELKGRRKTPPLGLRGGRGEL